MLQEPTWLSRLGMIAAAAGLFTGSLAGFYNVYSYFDQRFEQMDAKMEQRFDKMDAKLDQMLEKIGATLDSLAPTVS